MPLNCKPGQLARVLRGPDRDRIVECAFIVRTTPMMASHHPGPWWLVECQGWVVETEGWPAHDRFVFPDAWLQPIGNTTPEDAQDESLTWCPRPEQLEALS